MAQLRTASSTARSDLEPDTAAGYRPRPTPARQRRRPCRFVAGRLVPGMMLDVVDAVVFDLDGVLVDSEPVWEEVRRRYVADNGGQWRSDTQRRLMGMSTGEWARYLSEEMGVRRTAEQVATEVVEQMVARYAARVPCGGRTAGRRPGWVRGGGGLVKRSTVGRRRGYASGRGTPPAVPLGRGRADACGSGGGRHSCGDDGRRAGGEHRRLWSHLKSLWYGVGAAGGQHPDQSSAKQVNLLWRDVQGECGVDRHAQAFGGFLGEHQAKPPAAELALPDTAVA